MNKALELSAQIEQRILAGEWLPGDRLPSQVHLMADFGVARTTVRESLSQLQSRGVLRSQHGSGTYVNNLFESVFLPPLNQLPLHDSHTQLAVLEMRQVLEGEAAYHACQRASDVELQGISDEYQCMLQRPGKMPVIERSKADLKFHMLIAQASHNLIVASLSQLLYSKMFNTIFAARSGGLLEQPTYSEAVHSQHLRIHEALLNRDALEAKQAAEDHARHTAQMLRQQLQS